ncbi:MAG: tryptophan synthase subunit beta [Candidatus Kerfeldbacteria bacterium]|nr:tryptophan synthase subunit beta [Candidatus Kerfeldbacteria bacterium]
MKKLFFKTQYEPDEHGHFGEFGGQYVPELLIPALEELTQAYEQAKADPSFVATVHEVFKNYVGRPSPLYFAERLTKQLGGAKIFLKNEGLNHTGAHKINHCVGQALLAQRLGKTRLIAETGAGQHGVATATVAAKFGLHCTVHMGAVDVQRQAPNVFWMQQLGAEVRVVHDGSQTLKDAVTSALQDWMTDPIGSYYLLGSALGPHPYPVMVRDFQSIIGIEVAEQFQAYEGQGSVPDYLVACVGGGSNAIGLFNAFLDDKQVKLIGVEAGGRNPNQVGEHATRLGRQPQVGVIEGYKSFFLQDDDGNLQPTHSVSAGLDYPGIGPEHAYLYQQGRAQYVAVTDVQAVQAFRALANTEGIVPALESAHAVAYAIQLAPTLPPKKTIVVNISGRGDKDYFILRELIH